MKVNITYTKNPNDKWSLYTLNRLNNDIDPRDNETPKNYSQEDRINILIPFRQLFFDYQNYIGYDREYLSDNVVVFSHYFDVEINEVEFGTTFINYIRDLNNPIVSSFRQFLIDNNEPQYEVTYSVVDNNEVETVINV